MEHNQPPWIILETERLTLRHQQAEDVPFLVNLWADPEATRYTGGPRERAWLQTVFEATAAEPFADRFDLWPVVERASGRLVGHCGLLDKEVAGQTEYDLTYVFDPSVWGKGYATEMAHAIRQYAAEVFGLTRLIAIIDPHNVGSQRVAEKIGMRLERELLRDDGVVRRIYAVE